MMWALSDTWQVVLRDVRSRIRMPVFIFMNLFQPVLWLLLFTQIFKSLSGSVAGEGISYLDFFAPGVIVMTVLFGSAFAGMSTLMDMDSGVLSKMVATPVNRVSIITGRVLANVLVGLVQALIVFVVAAIMGVRVATGMPGVLLVLLLVALLGTGFAAFSNGLALLFKRTETVMATTNLLTMPLMFMSSMMMPSQALPDWLNTVRQFNPVDYAVVGVRNLVLYGYVWTDLWKSLLVLGAFAVVMVVFGTLMFGTRAE
ncbi:MAG: ABC transporter permease [Dehalococcoidia bacterium]|nr:ABC transporter permease [Dehalococcoidia bacterium]